MVTLPCPYLGNGIAAHNSRGISASKQSRDFRLGVFQIFLAGISRLNVMVSIRAVIRRDISEVSSKRLRAEPARPW
jgi:hypothetical protein